MRRAATSEDVTWLGFTLITALYGGLSLLFFGLSLHYEPGRWGAWAWYGSLLAVAALIFNWLSSRTRTQVTP